jgi:Fe-S-cluster containining protein
MTAKGFTEKYLEYDKKDNDWINKSRPCQFLNLQTNMCSIYDVRPADCAGFPHLNKKKMVDYIHVHKQNVEYCPATYLMVEQMMQRIDLGPQLPAVKIKRITLQK